MKIRNTLTIAVTAALLASSAPLFAASYNVTDLGNTDSVSSLNSIQINSRGQILAVADRARAFLYTNGVKKEITVNLKLPHPDNIFARFNDNGQAVGFSTEINSWWWTERRQGFVWANGIAKVLSVPSSVGRLAVSYTADFINNKGQILGNSDYILDGTGSSQGHPMGILRGHHVTLWNKNGTVSTDLTPNLDDLTESAHASGINNNGQVILGISKYQNGSILKTSSFIWENGTLTPLKSVGDAPSTFAYDINDRGQVVGQSNGQAILWDDHDDGNATVLAALGGTSNAFAINNQGEIIGHGKDADNTSHAAIWNDWDNSVTDLGANVELQAINNKGQVVGFDVSTPFVWEQGGSKVSLPPLPSNTFSGVVRPLVINDKGQIAGATQVGFNELHVTSWKLGK